MPDPIIEKITREAARAQIEGSKALIAAVSALTGMLERQNDSYSKSKIEFKGDKGDAPIFGIDFLKPEEMEKMSSDILKKATPKYGSDYMTPKEVADFLERITPKKGIHYNDGAPGKPGKSLTWADLSEAQRKSLQGEPGAPGKMPKHEWEGTKLRFEHAPGIWGSWHELQGQPGETKIKPQSMDEYIPRTTGATRFEDLRDVAQYKNNAGKAAIVNATMDGLIFASISGTDEKAGVEAGDTAGYLGAKIVAGTNIQVNIIGSVGNRQLQIVALNDTTATWGSIGGTLSDQTDLWTELYSTGIMRDGNYYPSSSVGYADSAGSTNSASYETSSGYRLAVNWNSSGYVYDGDGNPLNSVYADSAGSASVASTVSSLSGHDNTELSNGAGYITSAALSAYQPLDADLTAIAALASTGFAVRTASNTWAQRSLTAPAAGLTITNPAGIAGNPTFALANDLSALEALASTGIAVRTATDTWAQRTLVATSASIVITNGNGVSGNPSIDTAQDIRTSATPTFAALRLANSGSEMKVYNIQRTVGATVGDTIEVGNFAMTIAVGVMEIAISGFTGGNVQNQLFQFAMNYSGTENEWRTLLPISSEAFFGYSYSLDMKQDYGGTAYFRIRAKTTNNPSFNVTVRTFGYTSDAWTFTSATASGTSAPTKTFGGTLLSQRASTAGATASYLDCRAMKIVNRVSSDSNTLGWILGEDGTITVDGSFVNPVFKTIPISKTVPTVGNALDIMTISNSDFSSSIEVTMNIHRASFAQTKKYIIPLAYGATSGAWHKILPLYTSGPYATNDVALEVNISTGTATIRMNRVSGTTDPTTVTFTVISMGDAAATTVTVLSGAAYAAGAATIIYSPTSVSQLNGFTGIGTDAPLSGLDNTFSLGLGGILTSAATSLTLDATSTVYVFTGGTATTWTLPALSTTARRTYFIKNRGTVNITLQRAGSDTLYDTASVTSITITPGQSFIVINDGTYWLVM